MLPPEEAEAAAERVAERLHDRKPGDSIPRLLLGILAEEVKIHRLHMEERARQSGAGGPNAKDKDTKGDRPKPLWQKGLKHLQNVAQGRQPKNTDDSHFMMSGGAGPSGALNHDNPRSGEPRRGGRGRRSSPLGHPPTYQPKLGLTLGFASHVRQCIDYEAKRLAKEQQRKERRARGSLAERREARKATKSGRRGPRAEDDRKGRGRDPREGRGSDSRQPRGSDSRDSPGPEWNSRESQGEDGTESHVRYSGDSGESQPEHEQNRSDVLVYQQTSHSAEVEERERQQSRRIRPPSLEISEIEDYEDRAGRTPGWSFDNVPKGD